MGRRLTSKARAALYASECEKAKATGRGDYPICRLCPHPILPGQTWDQSHERHKPRWLGGTIDGIAHSRCNRSWNNIHDTPKFAKSERVRKRHLDLTRSATPLPGGRDDPRKRTMARGVVDRRTGEPWGSSSVRGVE